LKKLIKYCLAVVLGSSLAYGQATVGTITGTLTDVENSQPVVGANVTLRGTFIGSTTDVKGRFTLRRITPGTYTVVVSMLGYERLVIGGIAVRAGETRTMEIPIRSVPLQADPVVVTASRREQSLQEVPVSLSTVTARAISDRNIVNLDEALRFVPGVNMLSDQVNIRGSTGYSRGVGSRVLILLDGLPYITGDTGEINWESIPMFSVDRVEVVKGAGSALYGSSALGGVINVITKEISSQPELRFRLFSGLYDKPRYAEWEWTTKPRFNSGLFLSYSGTGGPVSYLVSAARTVDESFRENDAYHRWSLFAKARYVLSSSRSISVAVNYIDRSHGNFFWWKSLREPLRPADSQRDGLVNSKRGNISLAYNEFVTDKFFYTAKLIYFGNFWRDDSAGRVNNVSASHLISTDVQATYELSRPHVLTFGFAANYDRVSANLFGEHPGFGAAVYAQDEITPAPGLKVTAGLRFDWQKVSVLAPTSQLNPKLGVVYMPDKETSIRGSIGSGFRYPAIGELYIESSSNVSQVAVLPNTNLRVEKSTSFEVGISRTFLERVSVDVAVFNNDFRDLIEPSVDIRTYRRTPDAPNEVTGPVIQFENVTRARIQGVEAEIKTEWLRRVLSTDVGYTYTWPRDLDANAILKFRPRHLLYVSGQCSWEHARLVADFRFLSRIERIDDNLVRLAPIINGDQRVAVKIVDLRTSYDLIELGAPLRVGFTINNLLNYSYVELLGNLGPVRTYVLTLEGMF
jgi:outer membrane receptor for ferrienterochelin and colicins